MSHHPPVPITPPPPSPAVLAAPPFLPVPSPSLSVLSSSSSSSCCCWRRRRKGKLRVVAAHTTIVLCGLSRAFLVSVSQSVGGECGGVFVAMRGGGVATHATLVLVPPVLVLCVLHHPPTTLHHPVPVPVVLVLSMSPLLFPLTHTQAWHTTTPHTHTRGGWSTLVPGVCV